MSRYRNLRPRPRRGRWPKHPFLDAEYASEDEGEVIGPNGGDFSPQLMDPYERQRLQENTVQYEGDVAIATAAKPTQYVKKASTARICLEAYVRSLTKSHQPGLTRWAFPVSSFTKPPG
jgi:hypothetical protein